VSDSIPDELLVSSVLDSSHIREPLYVKALKYAGCNLTADKRPAHLNTLHIDEYKDELLAWYKSTKPAEPRVKTKPILKLDSVTFHYDENDPPILENINFSIDKGEMVSIVGKNGAGKS